MTGSQRVVVYIDGFNFYYGLRAMNNGKRFYWLDVWAMATRLLRAGEQLVGVHYFTARVSQPQSYQSRYLEALEEVSDVQVHYGKFLAKKHRCPQCQSVQRTNEEKMSDVNIAVEMVADAFGDVFDRGILISGDSDLTGPVKKICQHFPGKEVSVAFPPNRQSNDLKKTATAFQYINRATLRQSQMPPTITKKDGHVLRRPPKWL